MNHNPISTDTLPFTMVRMVPLSKVLEAIGHSDMGNDETDAFSDVSFGDAHSTLCSPLQVLDMIDRHLAYKDTEGTYTDEQSDRIRDFFYELDGYDIYINMER